MSAKKDVLRRYTNLAATIHLLRKKKITLLDPATWDDKVDVKVLAECGRLLGRRVLALCFAQGAQKYHHWRVFAGGMDGVCIEFNKEWLLGNLDARYEGLWHDDVKYMTYAKVSGNRPDMFELPFVKRKAYKDEKEYRIVRMFDEDKEPFAVRDYDIDLNCIRCVVLSPWMPKELRLSVRAILKSIEGCGELSVVASFIRDSESWRTLADDIYHKEEMDLKVPDRIASAD